MIQLLTRICSRRVRSSIVSYCIALFVGIALFEKISLPSEKPSA